MEIRRLTEDDAQIYWDLRREALETEPFAFGRDLAEHIEAGVAAIVPRLSGESGDNFTLGAFEEGSLIGTATFARETGRKERHKGHIYGVYVTAAERQKNVGYKLIAGLLKAVKEDATIEQIHLSVASGQERARKLYRKFGFETYGTEPRSLKVGARYIDEDHMILRL